MTEKRPSISSSFGETTSAGTTSATTTGVGWATARPTSTASPGRASSSPITTASRAAPRAGRRSSPGRTRCRADENSNTYWDWFLDHAYVAYIAQRVVANEIQSFVEFPPRQEPASFNLDDVLATLKDASGGGLH